VPLINADSITLVKKYDDAKLTLIEPSKIVRIIGKERTQGNSTPNLCKRKRLCKGSRRYKIGIRS
jgi:hypothetical protein